MNIKKCTIVLVIFLLISPSYAIFGIGGHLTTSTTTIDANTSSVGAASNNLSLIRGEGKAGFSGGLNIWLDFLPFIDLEYTLDIQSISYKASTDIAGNVSPISLENVDLPVPLFAFEDPIYVQVNHDFSILYPFLSFPPVINVIKFYVGAGLSVVNNIPIISANELEGVLADGSGVIDVTDGSTGVAGAFADNANFELNNHIGFHVVAGAKIKPPIIPISIFGNVKYRSISRLSEDINQGFSFEYGVAFAI